VDHFAKDIEQISTKFNIDAAMLAKVVRLVESIETLSAADSRAVSPEAGLLMAAPARKNNHTRQSKEGHDDSLPKP
jgi:hypothetical protein